MMCDERRCVCLGADGDPSRCFSLGAVYREESAFFGSFLFPSVRRHCFLRPLTRSHTPPSPASSTSLRSFALFSSSLLFFLALFPPPLPLFLTPPSPSPIDVCKAQFCWPSTLFFVSRRLSSPTFLYSPPKKLPTNSPPCAPFTRGHLGKNRSPLITFWFTRRIVSSPLGFVTARSSKYPSLFP